MEVWKTIPGFSRYQVSNTGRIRSKNYKNSKQTKELKPAIDDGYYKTMILNDNGKYNTVKIHNLVILTFMGKRQKDLVVNHKDGNKQNNNIENLEYCTQSENCLHSYKMGLQTPKRGESNGRSILNKNQVLEIREYAKKHGYLKNRKELAKKYKVAEATLKDIVSQRRNSWIIV